jgi:hypothetical protein
MQAVVYNPAIPQKLTAPIRVLACQRLYLSSPGTHPHLSEPFLQRQQNIHQTQPLLKRLPIGQVKPLSMVDTSGTICAIIAIKWIETYLRLIQGENSCQVCLLF